MKALLIGYICSISMFVYTRAEAEKTAYPFIESSTLKSHCDFVFNKKKNNLKPACVPCNSVMYVTTSALQRFFTTLHPHLKKYILVTHSEDISIPGVFATYLDDANLVAWFGKNPDGIQHSKFIPIPIGISPITRFNNNLKLLKKIMRECKNNKSRPIVAYVNFTTKDNNPDRIVALDYFLQTSFATVITQRITQEEYLHNLSKSMFVVSPEGKGLDCYRHWEAMLAGAIPIIKHSPLDELFENLPVLLIVDWHQITEDFLHEQYAQMQNKTYKREKLMADYWLDIISSYKKTNSF